MTNNLLQAVAVIRVSDFVAAEDFYCTQLGFVKNFAYQPDPASVNPTYASLSREGARFHVSSFTGDGVAGSNVMLVVQDVDALFKEFTARGVSIDLVPTDQTWGTREMYVRDPDGNSLRFSQPMAATEQNP